jgi:hypothetical protein
MGNCFGIVFGFLLDDGVNEARVNTFLLTSAKDNPIEIAIARQWNVYWYRLYLLSGLNDGRHDWAEKETGEIENNEERDDGKWCKLRRAQMQVLKTIR